MICNKNKKPQTDHVALRGISNVRIWKSDGGWGGVGWGRMGVLINSSGTQEKENETEDSTWHFLLYRATRRKSKTHPNKQTSSVLLLTYDGLTSHNILSNILQYLQHVFQLL